MPLLLLILVLYFHFMPLVLKANSFPVLAVGDLLCGILCFIICQMFSVGDWSGLQTGQFNNRTPLCTAEINKVYWKRRHLDGSICCSKTWKYSLALMEPSQMYKLPILLYVHHWSPIPLQMLCANKKPDGLSVVFEGAHAVISITKSYLFLIQCHLTARRSQAFSFLWVLWIF